MKVLLSTLLLSVCLSAVAQKSGDTESVNSFLNTWHLAAAKADLDTYISAMADDGVFVGTDATEHWGPKEFRKFAAPYFEKRQTWDFKPLQRHVYFSGDGNIVWFDELLDTWMSLCRGSGVLQKQSDGNWKIIHYVLSMTVPNDVVDEVVKIKKENEEKQKMSLGKK